MKRVIILSLAICMLMTCFSVAFAKSFSDLPSTHWAYKYVDDLSNKGIINGYEDGTFKPDGNVTKAEFIKLMMVTLRSEFFFQSFDVGGQWYEKYMFAAQLSGYLTTTVNEDTANEPITRMEIADVIDNVIWEEGFIKVDSSEIEEDMELYVGDMKNKVDFESIPDKAKLEMKYRKDEKLPFSDMEEMDDEQQQILFSNVELGIITGYEDGTFRPDNKVTRAEVSTMMQRLFAKHGVYISVAS